mmetsp:Transcript_15726/g.47562  ORF Transcript_15726/g.47562 Transcript_15726/m.47562 type:complete len:153 (-) Transcript_15726:115-573(-)
MLPRARSVEVLRSSPRNNHAAPGTPAPAASTGGGSIYEGLRGLEADQRDEFFRDFGIAAHKLRKRKLAKLVWQHKAHAVASARLILRLVGDYPSAADQEDDALQQHRVQQTPADRCRDGRLRAALLAAVHATMRHPPPSRPRREVSWRLPLS